MSARRRFGKEKIRRLRANIGYWRESLATIYGRKAPPQDDAAALLLAAYKRGALTKKRARRK